MSDDKRMITIWFLCGVILTVYGVTIAISGIHNIYNPPPVMKAELHLDLWWGFVLLAAGMIFVIHQWPGRIKK
jgi:uncharacterized membrane protein